MLNFARGRSQTRSTRSMPFAGMEYHDPKRKSNFVGKILMAAALTAVCIIMLKQSPTFGTPSQFSRHEEGVTHVLVTGGAGYIGSHAALRLLKESYRVTIVDNLSRGNIGAVKVLQELFPEPGRLQFIYADLGDAKAVNKIFSENAFDAVIHFAAVAYVGESTLDPLKYYHNITSNTLVVLEAMAAHGVNTIMATLVSLPSAYLTPRLTIDKLFFGPLLPISTSTKHNWDLNKSGKSRFCTIKSRLTTRTKESPSTNPDQLLKEPHKYFDQVIITVRSGDGGHGAILTMPSQQRATKSQGKHDNKEKSKKKLSYKRDFDGSLILPVGGHGGDVVIYADEGKDTLLELHKKSRHNAKRGGNVAAMGVLTSQLRDGLAAPTLRIPVPVGTVVKRKRGKLLADLKQPGDEVLVARGGQGGISLIEMPEYRRKKLMSLTTNVMRDESDKVLVLGQPGEEVSLELILRVVADVGLIGLPNAGKSTLLAAITLAKPDIADYPFTTLMPNLGRLDGDPDLGPGQYSSEATLADLPGLIEGAHLGKGLGRNFLRHLRRTRLLVHVVDASGDDPLNDYITVREELRMYNPNYLERPYVVVLNKIDLPKARDKLPHLTEEILKIGSDIVHSELGMSSRGEVQSLPTEGGEATTLSSAISVEDRMDKGIEDYPRPAAIVGVSVLKGIRVNDMLKEIRAALRKCRDSNDALELSARSRE